MNVPLTYISQAALARRLGLAPKTVATRMRSRGLQPDAILMQDGNGELDYLLFNISRMADLRTALGKTPVMTPTKKNIR